MWPIYEHCRNIHNPKRPHATKRDRDKERQIERERERDKGTEREREREDRERKLVTLKLLQIFA